MKFRGYKGMYTCDWQSAVMVPDLEENAIDAVLCISKNVKPQTTIDIYTVAKIPHYTISLDNLDDEKLEINLIRIARIIHHFVSQNGRVLIHTNEDSAVAVAMIFYSVWSYYHHGNGELKENTKRPEYSIASQTINELKVRNIETDLLQSMVHKLYRFEEKYCTK